MARLPSGGYPMTFSSSRICLTPRRVKFKKLRFEIFLLTTNFPTH